MINNKKIVFILGSMRRGGAERVVSIIANHYFQKAWKVDIILLLSGKCEYEINPKIRIISLANEAKTRLSQIPRWFFGIRSYLKENKPDSILSFAARINIIVAIAGIGIKKHLVVSERNDPLRDGRSVLVRMATNIIYPRVSKVIFQTKYAQSCFNTKIIRNSQIIPNPVSVNIKHKKERNGKIIAVGRLEPQKNHKLLIEAFKEVHDMFSQYSLIIYGEGSLRKELENMISELNLTDLVYLPGNISNIHEEVSKAEFFVLTSDYEGLSNSLLEAMMMGLPCISTACAGSNEVIVSGQNGLLVPVGNRNKLIEAMIKFINDWEFALRLGMEAEKTSIQFMPDTIIKKWEDVLEKS